MAAARHGSTIVVTGTTTLDAATYGKLDVVGIHNNATTSATVAIGSDVIWSAGTTKQTDAIEFRVDEDLVCTVTGGGSITLLLRV
jgi:hypothetical protein